MMSEIEQTMNNQNQNQTFDENATRERVVNEVTNVNVCHQNDETLRCFVCDSKVQGRRYSLATCKTHGSRVRVIEKLGELVGERYVVVINEDDVICRSCANLINTLDRLESETKRTKAAVLRFLECKYSLAKGELSEGANAPKPGQPPRITRRNCQSGDCGKRPSVPIGAANGDAKRKKNAVWMQCDKCKYTTLYDNFAVNHGRRHAEPRSRCDNCGDRFSGSPAVEHWCKNGGGADNSTVAANGAKDPQPIQTAPLETIDLTGTVDDVDTIGNLPILTIQPDLKTLAGSVRDEQMELISLTNANTMQFQNFLPNDVSVRDGQPMLMRVLQQFGVTEDINQLPVQHGITVGNGENGIVVNTTNSSAKQMLTITEDGSLEMVAIDWNDVNSSEHDQNINF